MGGQPGWEQRVYEAAEAAADLEARRSVTTAPVAPGRVRVFVYACICVSSNSTCAAVNMWTQGVAIEREAARTC